MARTPFSPLFLIGTVLGLFVPRSAPAGTPSHLWSQRFGGTGQDVGNAVAVDGWGNVYVAGHFGSSVDFGGGPLTSAGGLDVFLAKYNAAGIHLWSKRFGAGSSDIAYGLAVDTGGNVFVTGQFSGTVDFGGGPLVAIPPWYDIFLAKFSPEGGHLWSRRFGQEGLDRGTALAVEPSGGVIMAGAFGDTVDFGGGALVSNGMGTFLAKFSASGVHQWSRYLASSDLDYFDIPHPGVAVGWDGDVVVGGRFTGSAALGGDVLVSVGDDDAFLARYTGSGVHEWSHRFGGQNHDDAVGVAVDISGNVMLTGTFVGSADFGGGTLTSPGFGDSDIFLASYGPGGAHRWSQRFGDNSGNSSGGVAVDLWGNVILAGYFDGAFVAKCSPAGTLVWSQHYWTSQYDRGSSVAVGSDGNPAVTGLFYGGTLDFGGGPLTSAGVEDAFLVLYGAGMAEPRISSIADIGNDQGRQVRIRFTRSGQDDASTAPVLQYEALRRIDTLPAGAVPNAGPIVVDRALPPGDWEFVGAVPAHREPEYWMVAPTLADSTIAAGMYHSVFLIRAATADPGRFFDSAPDSGYSLDNLAPSVPAGLAYVAGLLSWQASAAADFDYFSVYGSTSSALDASAELLGRTTATAYDVAAARYPFYFVTATDFSGNEGRPASVNPLVGVGDVPRSYRLGVVVYPNPFNPATTIRYDVPSTGRVRVTIHDARGAQVTTLVDGLRTLGPHAVRWNGVDADGAPVTSGVYFIRVDCGSQTVSRKAVLSR